MKIMKLKDVLPFVLDNIQILKIDKSEMLKTYAVPLEKYDLNDDEAYEQCEEKYGENLVESFFAHEGLIHFYLH